MTRFNRQHLCIPALLAACIACTPGPGEKPAGENEKAGQGKSRPGGHSSQKPAPKKTGPASEHKDLKAPDKFAVTLDTTKGDIVIDVTRSWSPHGADRFFTLVKQGFYNDTAFFRVVAGFMAQVGVSGDPNLNMEWRRRTIPDDPVIKSNTRGMVSFAATGRPNSRTTQFFVNFGDNARLDRMNFAPFGKVRDMGVVDSLYAGYGEGAPRGSGPSQGRVQKQGAAYLKKEFPKLDYIVNATILGE